MLRSDPSAERGAAFLDEQARQDLPAPIRARRAVSIEALIRHEFPAREHVLDPVFTLASLNMLFSWRGVGKTHASLGIAYAASSGATLWGWQATRCFKVLYIDGEMPGEALQARLAAIVQASDAEPPPDHFRVLTIDLEGGRMPDLGTRDGQLEIADECEQAEVIVVDNLSCLVRSGRENEAEGWQAVAEWALSLRAKGKCVIFVHHAGKNGEQRGTSKREDLLDVSIALKRPSDYEPDQGARFVVHFEKARHLTGNQAQPFEAWLQADARGLSTWATKPHAEATFERVIDLANLGMSQKEIADELGIDKSRVCRHWRRAESEGLIVGKSEKKARPATQKRRADLDD